MVGATDQFWWRCEAASKSARGHSRGVAGEH